MEQMAALQTQNNELREEVKELKIRPTQVAQTSLIAATEQGFTQADAVALREEIKSDIASEIRKFEEMIKA
jgi:hypothetical protein